MITDTGTTEALRSACWTMGASAGIPVERRDEWCDLGVRLIKAELATANDSLDAAWQEAEAALPEGWVVEGTRRVLMAGLPKMQRWGATACPLTPKGRNWRGIYETQYADGPTPAAALRALAAVLLERAG